MAFSDPQSVVISAATIPLPRVNTGNNSSVYQSADGFVKLTASSAYGKRYRRVLRLDHSKITASPLLPSTNVPASMSTYIVFDTPPPGYYSNADVLAVYAGFKALYSATSDALVSKLIAGES